MKGVQTENYFHDRRDPQNSKWSELKVFSLQLDHWCCKSERQDERDDCYEVFSREEKNIDRKTSNDQLKARYQ